MNVLNNIIKLFKNNTFIQWISIIILILNFLLGIINRYNDKKLKINIQNTKIINKNQLNYEVIISNNNKEKIIIDSIYLYNKMKKIKKHININLCKKSFNDEDLNKIIKLKLPVKLLPQEVLYISFSRDEMEVLRQNLILGKTIIYLSLTSGKILKIKLTRKNIYSYFDLLVKNYIYNTI